MIYRLKLPSETVSMESCPNFNPLNSVVDEQKPKRKEKEVIPTLAAKNLV